MKIIDDKEGKHLVTFSFEVLIINYSLELNAEEQEVFSN